MEYYSIKTWPEDERPRERLLRQGPGSLSTAELLAIILRTGRRNKSALDLARELLIHFGSLQAVASAALAEFAPLKGMGEAKVAQMKASLEIGKRLLRSEMGDVRRHPAVSSSKDVYEYFMPRFHGLKKEKFLCALLDAKNRIFREAVISEGTLTASPVHPREVFREAIKDAAASVLFVHNHPSGDPAPSNDDLSITKRLTETGRIIGIHVLDHIIIGDGTYLSMLEKGYMRESL